VTNPDDTFRTSDQETQEFTVHGVLVLGLVHHQAQGPEECPLKLPALLHPALITSNFTKIVNIPVRLRTTLIELGVGGLVSKEINVPKGSLDSKFSELLAVVYRPVPPHRKDRQGGGNHAVRGDGRSVF